MYILNPTVWRTISRDLFYWQIRICTSILIIFSISLSAEAQTANHEQNVLDCAREANGNWVHYNSHDPSYRRNVLNCLGYTTYLINRGEINSKNCWIRIAKSALYEKCKLYNNSLSSLKELINVEMLWVRNANLKFVNGMSFKGSRCTADCTGHKAGYDWAFEKHVVEYGECNSQSPSFNKGCEIYVDEVHAGDHLIWNEQQM